jgi:hypothetical protein
LGIAIGNKSRILAFFGVSYLVLALIVDGWNVAKASERSWVIQMVIVFVPYRHI